MCDEYRFNHDRAHRAYIGGSGKVLEGSIYPPLFTSAHHIAEQLRDVLIDIVLILVTLDYRYLTVNCTTGTIGIAVHRSPWDFVLQFLVKLLTAAVRWATDPLR